MFEADTEGYPVAVTCDVLEVSTSGFYASLMREPSEQQQRRETIAEAAERAHHDELTESNVAREGTHHYVPRRYRELEDAETRVRVAEVNENNRRPRALSELVKHLRDGRQKK